jgi:hypothetical protein
VTSLVVDASVAAKWMLPAQGELLRQEVFRLLDAYGAGEVSLLVPDIFWAECGNIVGKAVRQQRLSPVDADLAMRSMMRRLIPTISSLIGCRKPCPLLSTLAAPSTSASTLLVPCSRKRSSSPPTSVWQTP